MGTRPCVGTVLYRLWPDGTSYTERYWRVAFTSRPSLWTSLDFANVDKARTYIQHSKCSPLEITVVRNYAGDPYFHEIFTLMAPHIRRLKSLTVHGHSLPSAPESLGDRAPLFEKLDISVAVFVPPTLDSTLFKGDLSSLRKLSLCGIITPLPCNNLLISQRSNLHLAF